VGAYSKQVERHAGNGFTAGLTRRIEHGRTMAWWEKTKVKGATPRTFTFDAEHNARQFFRNLVERDVGPIPAEESVEDRLRDAKEILRNPGEARGSRGRSGCGLFGLSPLASRSSAQGSRHRGYRRREEPCQILRGLGGFG
jgi:hypothetical protein